MGAVAGLERNIVEMEWNSCGVLLTKAINVTYHSKAVQFCHGPPSFRGLLEGGVGSFEFLPCHF